MLRNIQKEIKDALSYLRLVAEGDDVSFARIVNVPSRKIGKEKMRQFRELTQARGTTLYEAMKAGVAEKAFTQDGIVRFVEMIEGLRAEAQTLRISDLLNRTLEVSGLTDLYRKDGDEERRLMYVAITRAERHLFLTESEGYSMQAGCHKYPSRFIKEIKSNLFITEGDIDESL